MAGSYLRQATASQTRTTPPFVDSTDFQTAETGLTIANTDVKLMANGGASANKNSGGGTHRANGCYSLTFDATDTATVGELKVSIVVAGALPVYMTFTVLEEAIYDSLFASGASVIPANVTQLGGDAQSATDLKDFADAGYDPSTNKVQGVADLETDLAAAVADLASVKEVTDSFVPPSVETPPGAGLPSIGRKIVSGGYDRAIFFGDSQIQNMREAPVLFMARGGVRGYANAAGWYTANATFGALTATNDFADNSASQGSGKWAEITFLSLTSDASTTSTANRLLELARFGTPAGVNDSIEADWNSDEQRWALGSNWMSTRLAAGDLTVRMYYRTTPSGTTVANEYFVLKDGSTVIATSGFVSTYSASAGVAYVEATISQGTTAPTALNLEVRFRASTATETGKVSYWSARGEIYDPAATTGTIVHIFANGGYSAATYSNTGLFSDAAASIITAINPSCMILELGLNPTTDTAENYSTSFTTLTTRLRTFADCDIGYWAVAGRLSEDPTFGAEGAEPPFVRGNYLAQQATERSAFFNSSRLLLGVSALYAPNNAFIQWSGITLGRYVQLGVIVEHGGNLYVAKALHARSGTVPPSDTTNWLLLGTYSLSSNRYPKISDAQFVYDGLHVTRLGALAYCQSFIDAAYFVGWASGQATIAASVREELEVELSSLPTDGSPIALEDTLTTARNDIIGDISVVQVDTDEIKTVIGTPATTLAEDIAEIEAGVGSIDRAGADMVAARVNASRGEFYPNRNQVWVLRRTDGGVTVKNDFAITKKAGESLKVWVDFAGILGRNEAVESIESIDLDGGTATIVVDSEEIVGNLVAVTLTGGAADDVTALNLEVLTTEDQTITVDACTMNVVE